jgi:hypothetical protein
MMAELTITPVCRTRETRCSTPRQCLLYGCQELLKPEPDLTRDAAFALVDYVMKRPGVEPQVAWAWKVFSADYLRMRAGEPR